MNNALKKLVSIGSEAICPTMPIFPLGYGLEKRHNRYIELDCLLQEKNGFYAFESALHVIPSQCDDPIMTIEMWNAKGTWKNEFSCDLKEITFFAEDVFGMQFGIKENSIIKFDPETCEIDHFSETLDEWASKLLAEYDYETGYQLAHDWQKLNGPIPTGKRLLPKIPFVLGGQFKLSNLYLIDAVKGMHSRADLSRQIKDLPDGTNVEINIVE